MDQVRVDEAASVTEPEFDWVKLILKLRWIGMEDEARRLERAVSTLRPEQRGTVSVGPFSTD